MLSHNIWQTVRFIHNISYLKKQKKIVFVVMRLALVDYNGILKARAIHINNIMLKSSHMYY